MVPPTTPLLPTPSAPPLLPTPSAPPLLPTASLFASTVLSNATHGPPSTIIIVQSIDTSTMCVVGVVMCILPQWMLSSTYAEIIRSDTAGVGIDGGVTLLAGYDYEIHPAALLFHPCLLPEKKNCYGAFDVLSPPLLHPPSAGVGIDGGVTLLAGYDYEILPAALLFYLCLLPEKKNCYGPWKTTYLTENGSMAPTKINDQYLTNLLLKAKAKYAQLAGLNSMLSVEQNTTSDLGLGELLLEIILSSGKSKLDQIIIFRHGVSESQFSQDQELVRIIEACHFLDENWNPKFVVTVAQNMPPGTIIDIKICYPRHYDFNVCAYARMIGLQTIFSSFSSFFLC